MLEVKNVSKTFFKKKILAVSGVSFRVDAGKTLGILGGSGSGKSTLLRLIAGFEKPDQGEIYLDRKKTQMIFQDPQPSLNPKMRVREILSEPFILSDGRAPDVNKLAGLLWLVGLSKNLLDRYPREISGGEGQRVAIARALSVEPTLLLCDEVVSSLDALNKIRIVNLLLTLQRERGLAMVFVSHDEKILRHVSDEVLLMKDGRLTRPRLE